MLDYRTRRRRAVAQSQRPWVRRICILFVLLIVVLSKYTIDKPTAVGSQFLLQTGVAPPPAVPPGPTAASRAAHPAHSESLPSSPSPHATETHCDYYAGPDDPTYPMQQGYIDWDTYWEQANAYAIQRTGQYTDAERTLATVIWAEQKTAATTTAQRAARHQAMVAIGYVILHRRDIREGWFGTTNTLMEVLTDTRQDIQFQGYWQWHNRDALQDYILHRSANGVVTQPGLGWESPDRDLWFEALNIARGVLQGCKPDIMPDSLYFGHGDGVRRLMRIGAEQDSLFEYRGIPGSGLWLANRPFRHFGQ